MQLQNLNIDNSVLVFQSYDYLVNSFSFDLKEHVELQDQQSQGFLNIEDDKGDEIKIMEIPSLN